MICELRPFLLGPNNGFARATYIKMRGHARIIKDLSRKITKLTI